MKIFKTLYICWIVLCVAGWLISPLVGHNPDRIEEFFIMLGLIIFPPMVVNLWLFGITGVKKHLTRFLILLLCYPLGYVIYSIYYFGFKDFCIRILFILNKSFIGV